MIVYVKIYKFITAHLCSTFSVFKLRVILLLHLAKLFTL